MKKALKKIFLALAMTMTLFALVACVPSSVEKAKKKMAKEGYTVLSIDEDVLDALDIDGAVGGINATKRDGLSIDSLIAVRFASVKDAKAAIADWDALMNRFGAKGTAIRDGKWVYSGSEDGIEDFTD